jgi:drug/metabolite transporter (DMT)-like permease
MTASHRAMTQMAVFAVLFAVIEEIAEHLLHRYSPWQVVWTRYAVHVALMLAVWGWHEPASLWRTRRPVFQLARSLLMVAMPGAWILGSRMGVDVHTLLSVFWASPLVIMVLARIFLRERVRPALWLAALAGFAGALLLDPPGRFTPLHLLVFPVAMALSFSLYVVMTRELQTENERVNLFYTAFGVLLVLTPAMPAVWITPEPFDLAVMVAVGVIGYAGLLALDRMAHAAPVSIAAPFAWLQLPAFAGLTVVVSGGVQSPRRALLGVLLVAGMALYVWARDSRLLVADAPPAGAIR